MFVTNRCNKPMGGFECLRKRNEKVMEKEELLVENDRPKEVCLRSSFARTKKWDFFLGKKK